MTSKRLLDPAAKMLLDAAEYMERYGHHKGWFWGGPHYDPPERAPTCVMGALQAVNEWNPDVPFESYDRLKTAVGVKNLTAVTSWNDAPERTKEEVVAVLRQAALAG